jgi:hypothetical protein
MTLAEVLKQEMEGWATLGHAALLQRFVIRNGKPFTPRKRIGRKRKAKMCFSNSTDFVVRNRRGTYVEGYALSKKLPIMPIHHAWVTVDGNDAMDLTLNAWDYEYFGVTFDNDTLWAELRKLKRYGILDTGLGLNHELMFRLDPELEAICTKIRDDYKWRKDHERQDAAE